MASPARRLQLVVRSPEDESTPLTFDAFFHVYNRYVASIAARLLGRDDHELEDVVQDVFWTASRRLDRLIEPDAVRGWLATVTTRAVRRKLRRRAFRRLFHSDQPTADIPAPGASAEERAMLRRVYEVLDRLPIEQRLAWTLRHLEGESLERVAEACGCSLATAKRRVRAAHEVIHEVFRDG